LYAPIQRQNVELRLRIKPQISESDFVRLEIDEQTEEIASVDKTLGPTTSKRSAKTTIMAKDQETVVIGGLVQERVTKSVQKVPVLGSIPVLGWLFRNETSQKTKTNLLLFLTPYIIRDQSDFRRIFERKMAERSEFVKRFYGEDANYTASVDYERKLGPLQRVRASLNYELSKVENGGSGAVGEKVIGPAQKYVPPQLEDRTRTVTPEGTRPPPQEEKREPKEDKSPSDEPGATPPDKEEQKPEAAPPPEGKE
jgi:general secretion pathway protein D